MLDKLLRVFCIKWSQFKSTLASPPVPMLIKQSRIVKGFNQSLTSCVLQNDIFHVITVLKCGPMLTLLHLPFHMELAVLVL